MSFIFSIYRAQHRRKSILKLHHLVLNRINNEGNLISDALMKEYAVRCH